MALFIKTLNNDGTSSMVNFANVVRFGICLEGISYTPIYGNEIGGYTPMLVFCRKEWAKDIYEQICTFIAEHENGVFDAKAIIENYREEELKK